MLLNQIDADPSVKQILVVGGYNEFGSYSEIENAINAFYGVAQTRFPNAKIFVAMVAWSADSTQWNRFKIAKSVYNTQRKIGSILMEVNIFYTLTDSWGRTVFIQTWPDRNDFLPTLRKQ